MTIRGRISATVNLCELNHSDCATPRTCRVRRKKLESELTSLWRDEHDLGDAVDEMVVLPKSLKMKLCKFFDVGCEPTFFT